MTPLPAYVQIEPVGQCNLRCQMCPIQFRQDGPPHGPPAFMAFTDFTRIIDQFPTLQELHLQGLGEPMMHPRFFDMVRYAAAKGIHVSINTNLTLLTDRRAEQCVTSGLERLHGSLDGATAESYERIRHRSNFARVTRNLERLIAAKQRLGSELPYLHLVVVVMRQNLHELPELVRLAHRWQVRELFVQHLCHDFGEASLPDQYRPMRAFVQAQTLLADDEARIAQWFGAARDVAQELGVPLRLPRTRPKPHAPGTPGRTRCDWPWRGAYVSYQGYAMPCCMVATPDRINFGSMVEDGVIPIWTSAQYEAFRRQLDSDEPPDICRSCAAFTRTF